MAVAETTLTDAQIKALPTTGITLVAAPGAGIMVLPTHAVLIPSGFGANPYTNINASGYGGIVWGTGGNLIGSQAMDYLPNDAGNSLALLTDFLNGDDIWILTTAKYGTEASLDGWGTTYHKPGDVAVASNLPLQIGISNSGGGNLTGGNAANTLKIRIVYSLINL